MLYIAEKYWDLAPVIQFGQEWHSEYLYEWYTREDNDPLNPHLLHIDSHHRAGHRGSMLPAELVL